MGREITARSASVDGILTLLENFVIALGAAALCCYGCYQIHPLYHLMFLSIGSAFPLSPLIAQRAWTLGYSNPFQTWIFSKGRKKFLQSALGNGYYLVCSPAPCYLLDNPAYTGTGTVCGTLAMARRPGEGPGR